MNDDLFVAPGVVIPREAIAFHAVRGSGPGGQNVNKLATKVEIRVAIEAIVGLSEPARERLRRLAGKRLLEGDVLMVVSSEARTQGDNRMNAEAKLVELVAQSLVAPKPRRKTKPTKASKERRLGEKKARKDLKKRRGSVRDGD